MMLGRPGVNELREKLEITFLPVGDGDCALVQFDAGRFNVLIDAGPSKPQHAVSRTLQHLNRLVPHKVIDLAVVTHHDDDHIGGFLSLLQQDSGWTIQEMLFNSPRTIGHLLNPGAPQKISARHGHQLSELKSSTNRTVLKTGDRFPFFEQKAELVFLAPTEADLRQHGASVTALPPSPQKIRVRSPFHSAEQWALMPDVFKSDGSYSNLLSLAFVLRFGRQSWLFLGDAWPSTIVAGLDAVYGAERPHFELVKVSHHGSQGNTTAELVRRFNCTDYVVTATGRSHPDEAALRRMVQGTEAAVTFHFPQKTEGLEELLANAGLTVNYPQPDGLLAFSYEEPK